MKENRHTLFSPSMKLADIILKNYTLLSVLPRFGIPLGFGEKSLGEVCEKYGIDQRFFLLVCNVYTFNDYIPGQKELKGLNIEALLNYLQLSHNYYSSERIRAIEQDIEKLGESCSRQHSNIIRQFFAEYKQEVINHFSYEEDIVFPYVKALIKGETQINYHINQYEQNHSNIEDKLSDLKNIVIKYLPESCSSEARNNLIFEIFLFEEDLIKHARIENKILIPFVGEIEKGYEQ